MKNKMLLKVIIAVFLAFLVGIYSQDVTIRGAPLSDLYDVAGQLFLNALKLVVIPLVSSAIISGIGGLSNKGSLQRLGLKTAFYYLLTVLLAVLLGLAIVSLIPLPHVNIPLDNESVPLQLQMPETTEAFVKHILFKIVPSNIFLAISEGNMLGVIFFSLLFGFSLSKISGPPHETILKFTQGLFAIMMKITHSVMKLLPFGVFFLIARSISLYGFNSLASIFWFVLVVLIGLSLFLFGVIPLLLFLRGASPIRYFQSIYPALLAAFSTSSSVATLPITLECVEKRAGVSNQIASFVVPIGTSVNMTGSALYECVAALFLAHNLGIELGFIQQGMVVILSLLAAMGTAGIPSASLISLIIILNSLGLPAESIALVLPVERFLDMFRTVVNVASEAACAVMVARWEGEDVLSRHPKKQTT